MPCRVREDGHYHEHGTTGVPMDGDRVQNQFEGGVTPANKK